jgi:hypothetical protein
MQLVGNKYAVAKMCVHYADELALILQSNLMFIVKALTEHHIAQQDRKCTCNVTQARSRIIVDVEKQ